MQGVEKVSAKHLFACCGTSSGVGSPQRSSLHKCKDDRQLTIYPRLGYVEVERRSEDGFDRVYFEKRLS